MIVGQAMGLVVNDLQFFINQQVPVSLVRNVGDVREDLMRSKYKIGGEFFGLVEESS